MSEHHDYLGNLGELEAQIPLRITPELIDSSTYFIEKVDANSGYQAQQRYAAAKRWADDLKKGSYVWLGISGAGTPVGLGGYIADMLERGMVDAIVCTGANAYHDLHFACGLPVRHGTDKTDDSNLADEGITRIYTQFIHNEYTLKAQDMINQELGRRIFKRIKPPFSTATMLYELGREMLDDRSGIVIDKKGSFIARAAEFDVPIFLDSGSNHSLGMDFSLLALEGYNVDTSPTKDDLEAAALSIYTQPQLNVFFGEGGSRNFIQTTAPTASEIFNIPFEGSDSCIRFTVSDVRAGALSGSTKSEAVTWGKYKNPEGEVEVWGEYTLTAPPVIGYVAGKARKEPRRLMKKRDDIFAEFLEKIKKYEPERIAAQKKLREMLPYIVENEKRAREKAGYVFD